MGGPALALFLALLLCLAVRSHCQPLYNLITPSALRVDSEETLILEAHGQKSPVVAEITLSDFPQKRQIISQGQVSLNAENAFLVSAPIKVPVDLVKKDLKSNQYVFVTANSQQFRLERPVLVSFHSGYIFIQPDKTIYTPGSTVMYRLFTVGHKLDRNARTVHVEVVNPDGIVVEKNVLSSFDKTGIISKSYKIPDIVNLGFWKIVSTYEDAPAETFHTEFEVKEYVLPRFDLNVESPQKFFHIDDNEFQVDVSARFLYGKPVQGSAFVLFGIMVENEKRSIPNSLNKISIEDGKGSAILTRDMIQSRFPDINQLLGHFIYVTVTVLTNTGNDMVEAEKTGIPIVNSPFKIFFTNTPKYFKPGMSFVFMVSVLNPDGSPASGVPVQTISPGGASGVTGAEGTVQMVINTPADSSPLRISVKTAASGLPEVRQASVSMEAEAYGAREASKNYLNIGVHATELRAGDVLSVNFMLRNDDLNVQNEIQHFTYLILNKGKIAQVGRQPRQRGQTLVSMSLQITPEFIPSFRVVAYYYVASGDVKEIVADSVWVDVKDTCMGTLKVSGATERDNRIQEPGRPLTLKVMGDPGATVGLVAVDKAIYVLNKRYKLSQKKIWVMVEKQDLGCTAGSGRDSMGVFTDAGLALQTDTGIGNPPRSELQCPQNSRNRRSLIISGNKATKARAYVDQRLRKCCEDGMQENPMGYSCDRRARYILDGKDCSDAFLDCCRYIFEKPVIQKFAFVRRMQFMSKAVSVPPPPPPTDSEYLADEHIVSRSQFAESWLWQIETLPSEADRDGLSSKSLQVFLQDSITTWEVQAVSLRDSKGICVADPYEITVMKNFFIDLQLPYSVVRNEQVEIRAVCYNYAENDIKIRVELMYNENICSASSRESSFQQEFMIKSGSSHAVSYVIIPLTLGELEIEVKASVYGSLTADGVRKKLRVVPEGMKVFKNVKSVILNPSKSGTAGVQTVKIESLPKSDVVPNTEPETFISVKGDIVGDTVENSIDGANLKHLIQVPSGCGEQNMISMTPAVIATHYLDNTGQWEKLGVNRRAEAIKFIQQGYTQQLVYRKADNSYAAFNNRPSSTWLTAYVVKIFGMANKLIEIDPEVLCGAVKWLLLEKQKPDGIFQEDAPVIHGEMVGGTQGSEPEVSLTAFVLIAMAEAKEACSQYVNNLESSISTAGDYLQNRLSSLSKPYAVAISSYALSLLGRNIGNTNLMAHCTGGTRWQDPSSSLYTIEATSYALLAILTQKRFDLAAPVVQWLTEQRYYGGGYGSTQATVMVFQALAQYQAEAPQSNVINMDVSVKLPGRTLPIIWRLNLQNAMVSRTERTKFNEGFTVSATGEGQGTLTVMTVYYAPLTESAAACKKFEFTVSVENAPHEKKPEGAVSSVFITICMRFLGASDSTMTIVDISMLTGFTPDFDDLEKLTNRVDKYISKFEMDTQRSDRGSLIIYLDKVSNAENECLKFKAHQNFEVDLMQPAAVTVYEYYSLENRCTKFYHPSKEGGLLPKVCQEDACRCVEEKCTLKNKHTSALDHLMRIEAACEAGVDYVYRTQLLKMEERGTYDYFTMQIQEVIKEGTDTTIQGQSRRFISHRACRKALDLQLYKDYLIWGHSSDLWDLRTEMSYLLGSNTWIEVIPAPEECQQLNMRQLCLDLQMFSSHLTTFGCPH
ncbi:complement C3-like [Rhinatrema bivittatum]|uniref:complement C3-like n=1 Tax=Rhinatrema bivittatum TaxID=194408 RepID=UPI00112BA9B7|nr:complement C3-like [Rhinatrema bivittatum]